MNQRKRPEKHNIEDILMLTPLQEGILFHTLRHPESELYFEQLCLYMEAQLQVDLFVDAWNSVIVTNEMLRTVYRWKQVERPVQVVLKEQRVHFTQRDLSHLYREEQEKELESLCRVERQKSFDLENGPLLRVLLCWLGETRYVMVLNFHHIAFDGWSTGVILRELQTVYGELVQGRPGKLPEKSKFKEHLRWLKARDMVAEQAFWRKSLKGLNTKTELPMDNLHSMQKEVGVLAADTVEFALPQQVSRQLEDLSKRLGVTLPTILHAAWGILLQCFNNSNDVLFGTTLSGRLAEIAGIEQMVGLFINTVPVRVHTADEATLRELLVILHKEQIERQHYGHTPLVEIQAESELTGEGELFESLFVVENYPLDLFLTGNRMPSAISREIEHYTVEDGIASDKYLQIQKYTMFERTNYPLTVVVTLWEGLRFQLHYTADVFSSSTMERWGQYLQNILTKMQDHLEQPITEMEILSIEERQLLLSQFNDTQVDFQCEQTIVDLFFERAAMIPEAPAVVYGDVNLTNQVLAEVSSLLARRLWEFGVQEESIVAIMMEPSLDTVVGIFGILQAGGAYLPIDPHYPEERIRYILTDSGATVLLTQEKWECEMLLPAGVSVVTIDPYIRVVSARQGNCLCAEENDCARLVPETIAYSLYKKEWEHLSDRELYDQDPDFDGMLLASANTDRSNGNFPRSESLAYVIYTSGSTGRPKGVLLQHRSLLNLLRAMQREYPTTQHDTWLLKTPFTFDVSLTELFGWVLGGGRLAILAPGDEKDPQKIASAVEAYQVTHLNFIPSMYNAFMEYLEQRSNTVLSHLKYLMVAGEAISAEQVKRFYKQIETDVNLTDPTTVQCVGGCQFVNLYGPTETTIYATHFALEKAETYRSVPIGRPLANIRTYILDRNNRIQPIGFIGELCIAGEGVARGYLHLPDVTASRFVPDPFVPGERMYRTGDLARWFPDGNIEFLGRLDHQVKIRGYRIETGEIENHLLRHPAVKEAVVVDLIDENGLKYLCAYLVGVKEESLSELLRQDLAVVLPDYMIPAHFVWLDRMPLSSNGKMNRKLLPIPEDLQNRSESEYLPPQTQLEKQLTRVWEAVLGVQRVGRRDHFFQVLGGHSLKAVQVVAKIFKEYGAEIAVRDLFDNPTIEELAQAMQIGNKLAGAVDKVATHMIPMKGEGTKDQPTMFTQTPDPATYREIPVQPLQSFYPVSSAQKRLYVLQQLEPDSTAYNLPVILKLQGTIEPVRLEEVLQVLIQRHDALRTSFQVHNNLPVQAVALDIAFSLDSTDLSVLSQENSTSEFVPISQVLTRQFLKSFDLANAPLFRAHLVKAGEQTHYLWLDFHHSIADGVSLDILIEEFTQLYKGETLPVLKHQYRDFAVWQNESLLEGQMAVDEAFWSAEFAEDVPILDLPTDFQRPAVQCFAGKTFEICLNASLLSSLQQLADTAETTRFMLLCALYNLILAKYTGQEDLVIGTPVAARSHPDLQQTIGMFVNTLAIRTQPAVEKSFLQYLGEVKAKVLAALEHQDYPLENLLEKLNLTRVLSRNPLFDTVFLLQNTEGSRRRIELSHVQVQLHRVETAEAKFDLTLIADELGDELLLRFEYASKLFTAETIARMAKHFLCLAERVVENPEQELGELDILSRDEKDQLIFTLNDTRREYPEKTIQQLFAEQVARTPERVALRFDKQNWTYRQLSLQAERIATLLHARGVRPDTIVGLLTRRSLEMIAGILGILTAGGVYLPIDPGLPGERKYFLLQDAGVRILLTQGDIPEMLEFCEMGQWECMDLTHMNETIHERADCATSVGDEQTKLSIFDNAYFEEQTTPDHLAYIMYTSGSTGEPKGVMVPHRGVVRLLHNTNYIHLDENERIMQMAPYSFDASTLEIWAALLFGGELILMPEDIVLDVNKLSTAIQQAGVTTCWLTSSLFNRVMEDAPYGLQGVKQLLVGGEALSMPHVRKARQLLPDTRLVNGYGPTENTTFTCCYEITEVPESWKSIPIGQPISNTRVYILDSRQRCVPMGAVGEIYIAGAGLARGYLNRSQLTEERFIPNPLLPEEILYKSGDLGRYLPDGNIEFLGRRDHQVKIRGFRIELGEVEAALLKHPNIKQVVTTVKEDGERHKYLIAYIESADQLSVQELRNSLSRSLPDYMIPNRFILLEHLPLMPNGKIDRRALPEPEAEFALQAEYIAPRNHWEKLLCKIFADVLGVPRVGINDHFFSLGGHSLKAAQVTAKIAEEFGVELPLRNLFTHPNVRELAGVLETQHQSGDQGDPTQTGVDTLTELTIPGQPVRDYYPLSSAQQRIFILQQMGSDQIAYNIPSVILVEGSLDLDRFKAAVHTLIERHESLRTRFLLMNGEAVQQVCQEVQFEIAVTEVEEKLVIEYEKAFYSIAQEGQAYLESALGDEGDDLNTNFVQQMMQAFNRPFDLTKAPLMRIHLQRLTEARHILLLDIHHIIADGLSMEIFIHELIHLYSGRNLPPLRIHYRDYAVWQKYRLQGEELAQQKAYWKNHLTGELPVLNLPTDFPRPAVQSYEGSLYSFILDQTLQQRVQNLAEQNGVTLYMLLLAAYDLLLARLSGQEDLIVGSPMAGRSQPELRNLFGMFANTSALRSKPAGEKRFPSFLAEVRDSVLSAYENQEYPFELLVDELVHERDLSRHPLFDTMFDFQMIEMGNQEIQIDDLRMTPFAFVQRVAKFDVNLTVQEQETGIRFTFIYSKNLFKAETIQRFASCYRQILHGLVHDPAVPLGLVSLLTPEEKAQILSGFNDTLRDYPTGQSVYQLFADFAETQPEAVALYVGGDVLTYRQLNERANQLAHFLRKNEVKPETLVCIMMERSVQMIVAVLAVWKAGGAYVPVDPRYPQERIAYMLADSEAMILLSQSMFREKVVSGYNGSVLCLDELEEILKKEEITNPVGAAESTNLAYVIYTSGSTGKPKGVMVEQRNLLNSHYSWQEQFELCDRRPVLLQLASFSFDVFVADICRSIGSGGTMVLAVEERDSLPALYKLMVEQKVTIVNSTPGLLLPLMEYIASAELELPDLRHLLIGADSWTLRDYRQLLERFGSYFKIMNCYGVTEAAVDASWYRETENLPTHDGPLPIGKPIYNVQMYILDRYHNPVPVGVVGEMYIGGAGVSRGYWKRPELTAERFIPDPFAPFEKRGVPKCGTEVCQVGSKRIESGEARRIGSVDLIQVVGARLYRTGDLGRYLPDGNIDFLGRIDHQVKIRGYRIEIGEIEAAILQHPGVKQTVVVAEKGNDGNQYLAAYYTAKVALEHAELRKELGRILPDYMVPEHVIWLERFPLTPNSKVDLRALPEIRVEKHYQAPRTEVEARMVHLWEKVLGLKGIGIEDHFFQLGGHSLKGMLLLAEIYKEFQVELPMRQLFTHPVLQDLAGLLRNAVPANFQVISAQPDREYYPVSSAQKRLFVLHQFAPDEISYNMPAVVVVEDAFDLERLEHALHMLVQRHESLRTIFTLVNGEPVQKILSEAEIVVTVQDVVSTDGNEAIIIREFIQPFDLHQAPLMRVKLLRLASQDYLLLIDMHHIISDGVSMDLLVRELAAFYMGEELPALTLQYRDFAVWQNEFLMSEKMRLQEEYWLRKFTDEVPVLNLSTDFPRPPIQSMEGSNLQFTLPQPLWIRVQQRIQQTGTTPYMILLAAYTILLSKYTGQVDLIVGSPVAGRNHPGLQTVVGMFVNMLALRIHSAGEEQMSQFIAGIREEVLAAFEHQDYPFERLVDQLHLERDASRNPLFDVALVMQNTENLGRNMQLGEARLKDYPFDSPIAKFDLTLVAEEQGGILACTFNYGTKLFKRETIGRMAVHLCRILEAFVTEPEVQINAVEMITPEERQQLLYEWNQTQADYPQNRTIHQLFEDQVALSPERVAVTYAGKTLTYHELNQRANWVAVALHKFGVKPETLVGIMVERSLEMMIGIFAILKAGGAYVPLDPEYPEERIAYMLQDSAVPILLSQQSLQAKIPMNFRGMVLYLEQVGKSEKLSGMQMQQHADPELDSLADADNLPDLSKPEHLAYIIYTSGSTGKPKGVMIEHRNVVRLLKLQPANYDFHSDDVWTLFHSYCFDFSVWEIFGALLFGGKLVIVDQEARFDPVRFLALCREERVTVLNQTPAAFYNLIQAELQAKEHRLHEHLRYVIFGGESLNFNKLLPWVQIYSLQKIALVNMYGITETTVHVTYERIRESDLHTGYRSLVGKPIYTMKLYLLDQNRKPVPVSVPGEIYVGGLGVARGYLNRTELTAERFIANPFVPGERLYRSGDLGKFLSDGNLEYLGRIDQQVKIRGFRIEIGEIEETLLKHTEIQDVVVIPRINQQGGTDLAAYIVARSEHLTVSSVKEHMQKTLPDYMIPTAFVFLDHLPLTSNGKVNRKALPEPERSSTNQAEYEPPRDEVETTIATIWTMVLGIERVGIRENFFELGGNSLLLIQVYSAVQEAFPKVELKVTDLFKYNTIEMLADFFHTVLDKSVEGEIEDKDIEEFMM